MDEFVRRHPTAVRAAAATGVVLLASAFTRWAYLKYGQRKAARKDADAKERTAGTSSTFSSPSKARKPPALPSKVIIGTRSSQLALWQAHHVQDLLSAKYPDITFEVLPMNTMGDKDQIKPLADFGSKGVFTKELDQATLNDTIQIAVHCMKDLPTTLPAGLHMGAVLPRGDVEDVLVLPAGHPKAAKGSFEDLPAGAVIGTSAMRRAASVAKYYPHLKCENIRGNVNTRLAKLDRGEYAALILARVGLMRLGLSTRISATLDTHKFGYAVGQGALAIVCREDDAATQHLLQALDDTETRWACEAERAVLRKLQGGCKVPITIRTTIDNPSKKYLAEHPHSDASSVSSSYTAPAPALVKTLHVWCSVLSLDGQTEVHATHTDTLDASNATGCGPATALAKARALGETLGEKLLHKGADKLLEGIIDPQETGHRAPNKQ